MRRQHRKAAYAVELCWRDWAEDAIDDSEFIDRVDSIMREYIVCGWPPCSQPTDVRGPFTCSTHAIRAAKGESA